MRATKKILFILITISALVSVGSIWSDTRIPGTGIIPNISSIHDDLPVTDPKNLDSLNDIWQVEKQTIDTVSIMEFAETVIDGASGEVKGIFVQYEFAFPVVQQPVGQYAFVASDDDVVTNFALPQRYGVTGLMAHNYLAGRYFFFLSKGDLIQIIYGDGTILQYEVTDILEYQALQPDSPNSQFVDIKTSQEFSSAELFKKVYMGSHHLTLQTCIQIGTEDSWGRRFVIADPV